MQCVERLINRLHFSTVLFAYLKQLPKLLPELVRCAAQDHSHGTSTAKNVRTAVWDTKLRTSLLSRLPVSTPLSEGKGFNPIPCPAAFPPSRLKPEREQQRLVVFLRERKAQGAGHYFVRKEKKGTGTPIHRPCSNTFQGSVVVCLSTLVCSTSFFTTGCTLTWNNARP